MTQVDTATSRLTMKALLKLGSFQTSRYQRRVKPVGRNVFVQVSPNEPISKSAMGRKMYTR